MALTDGQSAGSITDAWGTVKITLAGTVVVGDVLGYSSGWKRALATTGTAIQGLLVAMEDGVSGDEISACRGCVLAGSRLSGGTAGAALYVAEGSDNGKYTETIPSTTGDCTTAVGFMLSTTSACLHPASAALTVAS
jgi:hypothetical protein